MGSGDGFTIVVPTRDDPAACEQLLEGLLGESAQVQLRLRVVFLANDTQASATERLQEIVSKDRFARLQPQMVRASRSWATAEENIRFTLGDHLDAVDDHFLIVGNTDHVDLAALKNAVLYLRQNQLDLLLVGVMNREVYKGETVRQLHKAPQHVLAKGRLHAHSCHGADVFSDAVADYGPIGYLAYIGCQIYTKRFFRELCSVIDELAEPLYCIPVATLELTTRAKWQIGLFPDVVATQLDHLQYGPDSPEEPPGSWIFQHRVDRGLSRHLLLSVIANSLRLSLPAFKALMNAQLVTITRGASQYVFSNFLFQFVLQMTNWVRVCSNDAAARYSAEELRDLRCFGQRLGQVSIGLSPDQSALISTWLQHGSAVATCEDLKTIEQWVSGSPAVLTLLGLRPGMERWIAVPL